MNNTPLISILIPVYNREDFISEAIKSIINQTYKNLEIIIYDDGSTDKTVKIIKQFEDERIKLYTGNKNKGNYYARNKCIEYANGNICCWQDSDDFSNKHRIQIQYDYIKDKTKTIVRTRSKKVKRKSTKKMIKQFMLGKSREKIAGPNPFASIMFRKNEAVPFCEKATMGGGDTAWARTMKYYKNCKDVCVDYLLYFIRYPLNRVSRLKKKPAYSKQRNESDKYLKEYCNKYGLIFEHQARIYSKEIYIKKQKIKKEKNVVRLKKLKRKKTKKK